MFDLIVGMAGALFLTLAAIGGVFVLGMRAKSPLVLGAVIWLTKHVFNPIGLKTAGQPGAYAARIIHRGRTSGRMYETPVGAVATEGGFLISLPYGLKSNWLRNVLASGSATLAFEGRTYLVDEPEMIPLQSVETAFGSGDQRMHRIFGLTEVLRLRRAEEVEVEAGVEVARAA